MSGYQRRLSTESFWWEGAPMVARKKRYKDALKVSEGFQHTTRVLGTVYTGLGEVAMPHQQGNRWLRSKEVLRSWTKAQSQSRGIIVRIIISRMTTDSVELNLTWSATKDHSNAHALEHIISKNKDSVLSDECRRNKLCYACIQRVWFGNQVHIIIGYFYS